jgi:hypothetical protein
MLWIIAAAHGRRGTLQLPKPYSIGKYYIPIDPKIQCLNVAHFAGHARPALPISTLFDNQSRLVQ